MERARAGFRLYLISDRKLAAEHGGLVAVVEAALNAAANAAPPGAVAVQLREKDLDARDLLELARALRLSCARFGAPLLINDRLDVAAAAGADGVHLPANSFAVPEARALLGPAKLIGVSTHQADEVASAAVAGADFAVFGPVYDPLSKAVYAPARGASLLAAACEAGKAMPVFALGGITPQRAKELAALTWPGAYRPAGAAVIGAVMGAADPGAATRALLLAMARWG